MANKLITDLTAVGASVTYDYVVEVQNPATNVTRKATVHKLSEYERLLRVAGDDQIEESCGLDTDGGLSDQWDNTYWLQDADFTAGITDAGGATGALDKNISNALRILDTRHNELYSVVMSVSGEILSIHVQLTATQAKNLYNGGAGYTLIPEPDTDYVIELLSACAYLNYATAAMNYGADTLDIFYDGTPGTTICSWTNAFLESAADLCMKGTWVGNYAMKQTKALKIRATSQNDATGTFTGSLHIFLTYRIHALPETGSGGVIPEE